MDELMINDEDEATEEDSENIEEPVLVVPPIAAEKKDQNKVKLLIFLNRKNE